VSGFEPYISLFLHTARGPKLFSLVAVFQRYHQEIIFPAAFIDPVDEIAVKRHIFNR
jgi:hypothetical protein